MENLFKQLVKEAVLEALNEFANGGVALADENPTNNSLDEKKEEGEGEGGNKPNDGKGGASEETSGGGLNNGRPIPDAGVGAFGLRK